jgi:flagellar motor switch/type III secretory pathway protein FliN
MATAQSLPAQANAQIHTPAAISSNQAPAGQALVPVAPQEREQVEAKVFSPQVALLPVELDVAVPVRDFRVRNLLALEAGQLIESQWGHGEDVPLASGEVQLAWSEFEVVESQLAVRVTRLA